MRDLVTGYTLTPMPVLYHVGGQIALLPGEQLQYGLSAQRYCTGYDQPDGRFGSCPEGAEAAMGNQCLECIRRTVREVCHVCTGNTCGNPARRASCVPVDHFVYLAFYQAELIKVGVTKAERLPARAVEQGAWAVIPIAQAGGQEARRIEHQIAQAGWVDRTQMLPLLVDGPPDREQVERLLRLELSKVTQRLSEIRFMREAPVTWVGDRYPAALERAPRQLDVRHDPLAGQVVGVRGSWLLLQAGEEAVACSLRGLPGRELRRLQLAPEAMGPAQQALQL